MKLINHTHVMRVADYNTAVKITCILRNRIKTKIKESVSKNSKGGEYYYSRKKMSFFNVDEAIEALKELTKCDSNHRANFDYSDYLEVMENAKADRLEFGKIVPDTTDEFETLYEEKAHSSMKLRTPEQQEAFSSRKKVKRTLFVEKFNNTNIIWR